MHPTLVVLVYNTSDKRQNHDGEDYKQGRIWLWLRLRRQGGACTRQKGSGVRVVGPMLACVEGEVHKGRLVLMLSKINDR